MTEEIRQLLIRNISQLNFVSLMKIIGYKSICSECKNYKWITSEEREFNWGWGCVKNYRLELCNCRGKEFVPKDSFIKEMGKKRVLEVSNL